ncbi:PIG-M-domain-containing protein [Catenaria anguillulae PL171]|uniref:GPI mannosyltransferase 1 n=1 Tax=Catenaria anguillulae PL171 TaxID=765915 RepID=A0A1Y2HYJ0_9FUNG|nr:PIG-M-domain-containing protein [Catenaria anguillulae PL171]
MLFAWPVAVTLGLLLRLGMLAWGAWQDAHLPVPYTDIDYHVFMDAAFAVARGGSPYDRATYRYTPLLAWILLPGTWSRWTWMWGKLLFVGADLIAAFLIRRLCTVTLARQPRRSKATSAQAVDRATVLTAACWLLNPFVANISTRGSAESFLCALCVAIPLLMYQRRLTLAAVTLGLAVHLKIYPGLYALPIVIHLLGRQPNKLLSRPWPSPAQWIQTIRFGIISLATFFALSALMYAVYGSEFIDHTYLYHITRTDHRHNFSVYFPLMYHQLSGTPAAKTSPSVSATAAAAASVPAASASALLPFVAQMSMVVLLGAVYAPVDLVVAMFMQTFAFVAFNKVMTSQYFMWWLCYLPMVLARMRGKIGWRRGLAWIGMWVLAQALWLQNAFLLEFRATNTFRQLFWSGLFLFAVHVGLLVEAVRLLQ